MNRNELVSVVIPVYNAADFIEETVNSVIQQTHSNIEIIIINDGSTDNTEKKLIELKKKDPRICIIQKINSGVCDARNAGYEIALGAFITFLDADDVWEYKFLEHCLRVLKDDNISAVYTKAELINENSDRLNQFIESNTIESVSDILEWKPGYVASMGCTIYRKNIVDKIGVFDNQLSTAADQDFHLRIALETPIVAIDKTLFYYRIHHNNMHQNIRVMERDHLIVFRKAKAQNLFKNRRFERKCYSNLYKIIGGSWWKEGNNKVKGLKFVTKSILIYPPIVKKYLS
jgi:glycosyltransferase involved in cell wall biosynthesis